MADRTVATIETRPGEEIRVGVSTYAGAVMVDVRVFAAVPKKLTRVATKRGVSFRLDRLRQIIAALEAVERRAGEGGGG